MHARTRRVAALALTLALMVPGAASAATSGTVNESFTVPATLSITLSVGSIDYGTVAKGGTSANFPLDVIVGADAPWQVSATATAFTSGANSIPATARRIGANPWADGTFMTGTGNDNAVYQMSLQVPAGSIPGTYTGSMTWTISGT